MVQFLFLLIISFLIVAFGEPAWSSALSLLAASVGYALFWKALLQKPSKVYRFFLATLWFAAVFAVHISWLSTTTLVGIPILLLYFLLIVIVGLQFGVLTLFIPIDRPLSHSRIYFIAGIWVLFEYSRLFILSGLSWNPVGLALTSSHYSLQLVSVVGVYGLSFLVILANLYVLKILRYEGVRRTKWSCFALLIFPYIFGYLTLQYHERKSLDEKEELSALLVQPAMLPDERMMKWSPLQQWERIFHHLSPYYNKEKIDLIVLPEGAIPYHADLPLYPYNLLAAYLSNYFGQETLDQLPKASAWVSNQYVALALAHIFSSDVIVGFEALEKKDTGVFVFQSAFHARKDQECVRYDKRILVPIGEYIPFVWCKKLAAHFGVFDSFTPGDSAKLFSGKVLMSPSICYEETYGHLMREGRLLGASCFINITNDGWYPNSKLPEQHFVHSKLRSVENGVPLLRACNTGVTAFIDSLGRVKAQLPLDQELKSSALFSKISLYTYQTLYTFWGDSLILALSFFFILSFLLKIKTKDMLF